MTIFQLVFASILAFAAAEAKPGNLYTSPAVYNAYSAPLAYSALPYASPYASPYYSGSYLKPLAYSAPYSSPYAYNYNYAYKPLAYTYGSALIH